jgi:hypothetical protein
MELSQAVSHTREARDNYPDVLKLPEESITFKMASTKSELEQSYRLLHDTYVLSGFMKPEPSGMRISIYNAVPGTRTFVAIAKGRVVGCMSYIADSPLGLPMDQIYGSELNEIRRAGRRPIEISGFAAKREYVQQGPRILLNLVSLLSGHYIIDGIDDSCIAINPAHKGFYEKTFYYEVFGGFKTYNSVNDAPAYALRLKTEAFLENCRSRTNRIYRFLGDKLESAIERARLLGNQDMSESMLQYFFCQKTHILNQAPPEVHNFIRTAYPSYDFGKTPSRPYSANEFFFQGFQPLPLSF